MNFKDILKRTTLGDKILVILLSVFTGVSFPLLYAHSKQGEWGIIEVNGKLVRKVPLYEKNSYMIKGYLYETPIEIKAGTIEIKDITCPNPLLHSGKISRTGEFRVCVHNRTVIRIEGEDSRDIDVITK